MVVMNKRRQIGPRYARPKGIILGRTCNVHAWISLPPATTSSRCLLDRDGWIARARSRQGGTNYPSSFAFAANNHRVPNSAKGGGVMMPLLLSARRAYDPARPSKIKPFSRLINLHALWRLEWPMHGRCMSPIWCPLMLRHAYSFMSCRPVLKIYK